MKALRIIFILFPFFLQAQTPGFKFGPRIGIGISQFTRMDNVHSENVAALQIGLCARKQLTKYFALEFCPMVGTYGGRTLGSEQDGYDSLGNPQLYTYRDNLRVGVVEFPLMVKFSVGVNKFYVDAFFGPSVCVTMFGIHSRNYDDDKYNPGHGYSGVSIRNLYDGCYSGIAGIGIEKETAKGVFGVDLRIHQLLTPMGKIEDSKFYIGACTLGVTWLR
jgi:hypothetical protein